MSAARSNTRSVTQTQWGRGGSASFSTLPVFSGARRNAGHTATVDHPGGGEWANVASNWLRWQFKGDKEAAAEVNVQTLYIDKASGLPARNVVTKAGSDKRLFDGTFSTPSDIVINAPG